MQYMLGNEGIADEIDVNKLNVILTNFIESLRKQPSLQSVLKENKPVFIDFTGASCSNCREMEANVWSDPQVLKMLKNDYVVVALYVDSKIKLPENEWITSTYDGKVKKTVGDKNFDFQITRFTANAQPYYVLLDTDGKQLCKPKAYDLDIEKFIKFLENGIKKQKAGSK